MKVTSFGPSTDYPRPMIGIALMISAVSLFSVMDSGAKYLAERYLVILVTWARFFFNVLVMLVVLGPIFRRRLIQTRRPRLQIVRGLALGLSSVLFVAALAHMRLADASAVTFVTPMLVTLGTAICAATYQLLTSRVAGIDSGTTSLFIGALVALALLTIPVLFVWEWPRSTTDAVLFVGIGTLGALSHYLIIRSFEYAPAAILAPYAYLQIIAALVLGFVVFGHFPGLLAIGGIGLIVATGVVMALRQRFVTGRGRPDEA